MAARITSRQNGRVKEAAALRDRRERLRQGRLIIDGAREIRRALAAGIHPVEVYICPELAESDEATIAWQTAKSAGADVFEVAGSVYAKLQFGERDDGVIVIAETPRRSLQELQLPTEPLIAILESVEKPGNVGAILRSADAAGVDAVIIADGGTDLYNPNTIRASIGTVFRENVCEATTADTLDWLRTHNVQIFTARPDAAIVYTNADLRGSTAIVLGSEARGLSDVWAGHDIMAVKLPMHGIADSLNVSTAAAVLFYEARRQREIQV
jgi:RNA methyltransferase, TrmH family